MKKIVYEVQVSEWRFDSYGNEYRYEDWEKREAIRVYHKPKNFCDAITAYYAAECDEEEAERICKEYNAKRDNAFAPSMSAEAVPYGMLFTIREPYDD